MPIPFTFGRKVSIPDDELVSGAELNVESYTGNRQFSSMGIHVNSSSDEDEQAAGYAFITGVLVGENKPEAAAYRVPLGQCSPLAFKIIMGTGTTARGIKIGTEI